MKIIVLIICSDTMPVYKSLQQLWGKYLNSCPDITGYFIRGHYSAQNKTPDNTLCFHDIPETYIPGILLKTMAAFKHIESQHSYDFVVRTNLSSFYIFDRLLKFLRSIPEEEVYVGSPVNNGSFTYASGSGFILSRDLVRRVLQNETAVRKIPGYDDEVIGYFLSSELGIKLTPMRLLAFDDFLKYDSSDPKYQQKIEEVFLDATLFQVRVKNPHDRIHVDPRILEDLYQIFYS